MTTNINGFEIEELEDYPNIENSVISLYKDDIVYLISTNSENNQKYITLINSKTGKRIRISI